MTPVEKSLTVIGRALAGAREPWWVIGAAAVMLHRPARATAIAPANVDVLLGQGDAPLVLARLGITPGSDGGDGRFRSAVFVRWSGAGAPVDLMAGFEVRDDDGAWRAVTPRTRVHFLVDGVSVFAPDVAELASLLGRFGRPKDLARRALLES